MSAITHLLHQLPARALQRILEFCASVYDAHAFCHTTKQLRQRIQHAVSLRALAQRFARAPHLSPLFPGRLLDLSGFGEMPYIAGDVAWAFNLRTSELQLYDLADNIFLRIDLAHILPELELLVNDFTGTLAHSENHTCWVLARDDLLSALYVPGSLRAGARPETLRKQFDPPIQHPDGHSASVVVAPSGEYIVVADWTSLRVVQVCRAAHKVSDEEVGEARFTPPPAASAGVAQSERKRAHAHALSAASHASPSLLVINSPGGGRLVRRKLMVLKELPEMRQRMAKFEESETFLFILKGDEADRFEMAFFLGNGQMLPPPDCVLNEGTTVQVGERAVLCETPITTAIDEPQKASAAAALVGEASMGTSAAPPSEKSLLRGAVKQLHIWQLVSGEAFLLPLYLGKCAGATAAAAGGARRAVLQANGRLVLILGGPSSNTLVALYRTDTGAEVPLPAELNEQRSSVVHTTRHGIIIFKHFDADFSIYCAFDPWQGHVDELCVSIAEFDADAASDAERDWYDAGESICSPCKDAMLWPVQDPQGVGWSWILCSSATGVPKLTKFESTLEDAADEVFTQFCLAWSFPGLVLLTVRTAHDVEMARHIVRRIADASPSLSEESGGSGVGSSYFGLDDDKAAFITYAGVWSPNTPVDADGALHGIWHRLPSTSCAEIGTHCVSYNGRWIIIGGGGGSDMMIVDVDELRTMGERQWFTDVQEQLRMRAGSNASAHVRFAM
ncbi:hypothetical protein K437DRAFT_103097 [Tilletiaria anomala UBC 951]|uniref:Uncharacterized protein n=1 Tax=Tilletiaria anomala (strain ATCC 24038 / CBS 436.72 / UBC 951) TaxID=1037660 RepID=A0A066W8A0_TILAU|nr:uncharacterized protein K437DRAFT_103097 [Tilletiaria anomala UBC 951]KDN47000.1 hypothetical protein K437DRAFT_103097 [Tilletiaria anomala UBC 951]